jgi:hypothetical protein
MEIKDPMMRFQSFDVFLSYSRIDKSWADRLMRALEGHGLAVWIDEQQIKPGEMVVAALERGIAESRSVALVVSKASVQSGWVQEEYARAIELTKSATSPIQLIPVLIEEAPIPGFLASRNFVDLRNVDTPTEFLAAVRRLVWGITGAKPEAQAFTRGKKGVLLDRRIIMDLMLLLSGAARTHAMDRAVNLVRCGSALYGSAFFENVYGSAYHALTRRAETASVPVLTELPNLKRNDEGLLSSLAEDTRDSWLTSPEFSLELKRYIQSAGGKGTPEQIVEYLDLSLRLARKFQLAIVPHPDRWMLYQWLFENCEDAARPRFSTRQLVDCPTGMLDSAPRFVEASEADGRGSHASTDRSVTIVSFGPHVYPAGVEATRHYDASDLSHLKTTMYQFIVGQNPLGAQED